jgi:hypothetical protein
MPVTMPRSKRSKRTFVSPMKARQVPDLSPKDVRKVTEDTSSFRHEYDQDVTEN